MQYKNLAEMFFNKRETLGEKAAYRFKEHGQWNEVSFKEVVDTVEKIAAGLSAKGIKKGDRVGLISPNRKEWAYTDYATITMGAILVPIYPSLLADQIKYILNDAEAKLLVVSDEIQMEKLQPVLDDLEHTKHFYILDFEGDKLPAPWKPYNDLITEGEQFLKKNEKYVIDQIKKIDSDDWCSIIYTSGTTGRPKGAILTHTNFLHNIESSTSILPITQEDTFLSFLPLSHIFERMAGHYLSFYHGCTVAYAESIDTVAENLGEIRPTVMVSVPRLYEKIYARVIENVENGPPLKRHIFNWAIKVGDRYIEKVMNKQAVGGTLAIKNKLAYKLVFKKLKERVGGKLRFFVSGGAPLSPEIAKFFGSAGLLILEGYGLTETSPVIAVNRLDNFRFGTVGPPIPEVEVKIAEDGEILTRGAHVMKGYYKLEEETREAIDEDGWFHTGDIGIIEDGFLRITDRKKNIIVTSGGKNIAPQPIENNLINSKYIEQAMLVGDKRKFCSAVIVLGEDAVRSWLKEKNITADNYDEMIKKTEVKELIRSEIDRVTAHLARYETIKDFILANEPFSIENEQLTPSLKIKRHVVEKVYGGEIDAIYE
ncbi:MAG: AMP-binding protein, partial [Caldithrix sp.]|nr:AMP-binding protein [Caldithrix sp.]